MPRPTRPLHGESAESRMRARRQQLLDQAFALSAKDGWRKLSIHQLCTQAGLNKRYFYESFDSLDALGAALVDDLAERLIRIGQEAVMQGVQQGLETADLARYVLDDCITWLTEEPARVRLLFSSAADNPRALAQRKAVIRKMAQTLSAFSVEYHQAGGPLPIAHVGSALLVGGTIEAIMAWLDGGIAISRDELVEDIACFWVAAGDGAIALTRRRRGEELAGQ